MQSTRGPLQPTRLGWVVGPADVELADGGVGRGACTASAPAGLWDIAKGEGFKEGENRGRLARGSGCDGGRDRLGTKWVGGA